MRGLQPCKRDRVQGAVLAFAVLLGSVGAFSSVAADHDVDPCSLHDAAAVTASDPRTIQVRWSIGNGSAVSHVHVQRDDTTGDSLAPLNVTLADAATGPAPYDFHVDDTEALGDGELRRYDLVPLCESRGWATGPTVGPLEADTQSVPSRPRSLEAAHIPHGSDLGDVCGPSVEEAAEVKLMWEAPEDLGGPGVEITEYVVHRGGNASTLSPLATVPIGEFADRGATQDWGYFYDCGVDHPLTEVYAVSAVNGIGEGPKSNATEPLEDPLPEDLVVEVLAPLTRDRSPRQLNPDQTVHFEVRAEKEGGEVASVAVHPDGSSLPGLPTRKVLGDPRGQVWRTDAFAYGSTGVKTVVAEVTDAEGTTTNVTDLLVVTTNQPPVARIVEDPIRVDGVEPTVLLDGSPSRDPDDRPVAYTWEVDGDEVFRTASAWRPQPIGWTPDAAGVHAAKLTVRDSEDVSDTATATVLVDDAVGVTARSRERFVGVADRPIVTADVVGAAGQPRSGVTVWFNVTHLPTGQTTASVDATTDAAGHVEVPLPRDVPLGPAGVNLVGDHRVDVEALAANALSFEDDPGPWERGRTAFTYEVRVGG